MKKEGIQTRKRKPKSVTKPKTPIKTEACDGKSQSSPIGGTSASNASTTPSPPSGIAVSSHNPHMMMPSTPSSGSMPGIHSLSLATPETSPGMASPGSLSSSSQSVFPSPSPPKAMTMHMDRESVTLSMAGSTGAGMNPVSVGANWLYSLDSRKNYLPFRSYSDNREWR